MFDRLADLADSGPLLCGHCKKLLARPFALCAWLVAETFPDLRMHRIRQDSVTSLASLSSDRSVAWRISAHRWHRSRENLGSSASGGMLLPVRV